MNLRIKDETHRLARELSRLTGEGVSVAVDRAIRERLGRVRDRQGLAKRLLEIGKECAAHFKEPYKSIDHGDLLYDEKGLLK